MGPKNYIHLFKKSDFASVENITIFISKTNQTASKMFDLKLNDVQQQAVWL